VIELIWRQPQGALLATAADVGYPRSGMVRRYPCQGFYYRSLTAQGKNAPGAARESMVKGRVIGGFAVIAYPASYGISDVVRFIVNHDALL